MKLAIVGGGPSALFLFKRLVECGRTNLAVTLFEKGPELGVGMPYGHAGANREHVTNVSSSEVPDLPEALREWLQNLPDAHLEFYGLSKAHLSEYRVIPRLLFGEYLRSEFERLLAQSRFPTEICLNTTVTDVERLGNGAFRTHLSGGTAPEFDAVILCSGHTWPTRYEGNHPGYFESPYPPCKLQRRTNHPVAIRGASLTAIDAIRTLARANGAFVREDEALHYVPADDAEAFCIVLHTLHGALPAVRFHYENPHEYEKCEQARQTLEAHRAKNGGFVALDFVFEQFFKREFVDSDPAFHAAIRELTMEEFVDRMLTPRELSDPFAYLEWEMAEAHRSISQRESILWKEKLYLLSTALNGPAKYFAAEDRLRVQRALMPLISLVIASVPQESCHELLALHRAGRLEMVVVGSESRVEPRDPQGVNYHLGAPMSGEVRAYEMFVDCTGQRALAFDEFPFPSLVRSGTVSPARLPFRSSEAAEQEADHGRAPVECLQGRYYLRVPGVAIDDAFRAVDAEGNVVPGLFVMAVPLIGGFNPDYSGLDFCETASLRVVDSLTSEGRSC